MRWRACPARIRLLPMKTTSYLRRAAGVVVAGLALAAPARGQVGIFDDPDSLLGCYSFKGVDEQAERAVEQRFRLTAEPSFPETLPGGPWRVVTAVPGEVPQPGTVSWALRANSLIIVLWDFESVRVLLQFPQLTDLASDPVEGMLAGPGPEQGIAQTARGFVVRVPC
jgi:hypothetical protein